MTEGGPWSVESSTGSAADFHARPVPRDTGRAVWIFAVTRPALVLGSTQDPSSVDRDAAAAAGIEVVRRRSGGGAVLLDPGGAVWLDVVLPAGDPLWDDDVGRAFSWLGAAWGAALTVLGHDAAVQHLAAPPTTWSRLVCFAGLGPGEVVVGGRKAVGLSQRRTRTSARFQCAAHLRWDPDRLLGLFALSPPQRAEARAALEDRVFEVPGPAERLVAALLAALPE